MLHFHSKSLTSSSLIFAQLGADPSSGTVAELEHAIMGVFWIEKDAFDVNTRIQCVLISWRPPYRFTT
jgi:hypothetical protein